MSRSRLLFVDDEPHSLSGLWRMVKSRESHWDMFFTSDPQAAWRYLDEYDFDAVVTDVQMPVISGLQLLDKVRFKDRTKDVPVVMISDSSEAELKRKVLERGAHDLLYKPFWPEDLCARLTSALALKSRHDELKQANRALEASLQQRTRQLYMSRAETVWRLAKAAEYRDDVTGNHVVRVGYYSRIIAEAMGLSADFADALFLAAPLHDVGKIGIPDSILHKPGPLTASEWAIMKRHCVIGKEILEGDARGAMAFKAWKGMELDWAGCENNILDVAAQIAHTHHEKWNGSGYPHNIAGDSIPLESRIVAVSDSFDALTSLRPYKGPVEESMAVAIMSRDVGTHFDPQVYEAFLRSLPAIQLVHRSLGDNQQAAISDSLGSNDSTASAREDLAETPAFTPLLPGGTPQVLLTADKPLGPCRDHPQTTCD